VLGAIAAALVYRYLRGSESEPGWKIDSSSA